MWKFLLLAFRNVFRNRRRTLMTLTMVGGGVAGLLLVGGFEACARARLTTDLAIYRSTLRTTFAATRRGRLRLALTIGSRWRGWFPVAAMCEGSRRGLSSTECSRTA